MSETALPPWASRQAAVVLAMLETTEEGVRDGQPADRVLHTIIGGNRKYGSRDRRLIRDAVFSWFRWHGAIGTFPLARGLCMAWMFEGKEWPAALQAMLNEFSIELPDVLASELSLDDRKAAVEETFSVELPAVDQWLPEWWKTETAHLGAYEDRLAEHFQRPPTWIRVDQKAQNILHPQLIEDGAEWAGESCPCAYSFDDPGKVNRWLQSQSEHIEIQDLSSQQVVRICDPKPNQKWWDACCGNGGKSLQLLDQAERTLDLTCTDRREEVLRELTKRGRRHGLSKVRRYVLDLLQKEILLPNIQFDGVLIDAPCSGTGTWSRNSDAPWRTEASDIPQGGRRQLRLLQATAPSVAEGAILIFAVCSLCKTETLDVVEGFLESNPAFSLRKFTHPLNGSETDGTVTFLPSETKGDGMFVATFIKKKA